MGSVLVTVTRDLKKYAARNVQELTSTIYNHILMLFKTFLHMYTVVCGRTIVLKPKLVVTE